MEQTANRGVRWSLAAILVFSFFLLVAGWIVADGGNEAKAEEGDKEATTTTEAALPADQEAVTDYLANLGWVEGEYTFDLTDVEGQEEERSPRAFGDETLWTQEAIAHQLALDDPRAEAIRRSVEACMLDQGYPASEYERFLSGEGHVGVGFLTEAVWQGNGYYTRGIVEYGSERWVGPGDIAWLYVTSDGEVLECATLRGDCSNPGGRPEPPPDKPPGSTTTTTVAPPTTTEPPVTTTTVAKEEKDPCESTVSRPSWCDDPENDDPRDDPSGTQPPRPSTTTTTSAEEDPPADSGSGAVSTTTPPTTVAPAPAPPTTASPTTTIAAP